MTCTSCGNIIAPDARFCTRCGASCLPAPPLYRDRVGRHLHALGVVWLIYACLRAMTGIVGLAFLHRFLGEHTFAFFPIWPFAGIALGIGVIGALLSGYALLTRQPWGRVVAIIFGVFSLLHPLIGTAVGIYTLWVLAPRDSGLAYERETAYRRPI